MSQTFPILVKVWAGKDKHDFRYIRRSLPSLLASKLPDDARVILVDDRSIDTRVAPYLAGLASRYPHVDVWTNPERMGPNRGHAYNFNRIVECFPDAPFFVTCDDDVIYHPGWLQRLIAVHAEARTRGVNGIFAALNIPARETVDTIALPTSRVLVKRRHPALNWFLPRDVYDAVGPFRDSGIAFDSDYCNRAEPLGIQVLCLQPSWVQNIGYHGAYQSDDTLRAHDYVGQMDMYLRARDVRWWLQRRTLDRAHVWLDSPPETPLKAATRHLARRVRNVVVG